LTFQVGIRNVSTTSDRISVDTMDATAATLGVDVLELTSASSSQQALGTIDAAIERISAARATLGAAGNRFNAVANTIRTASENLAAAHSRIKDVDVAEETAAMSRAQILAQAGVSVLAQANQVPQMAMKLLG
jgi:flagellin